jgi:hypothetical protein
MEAHPPDIVPISRRSAQDDLLEYGAVVILRFFGLSKAPTPTGFNFCLEIRL